MSLPKLNQNLNIKIKIPSLRKEFKARPYLAKEEKILLFAAETGDPKQFLQSTKQIIENCVDLGNVDISDLTMFDIEYVFLKLRSFSVGETVAIKSKCSVCDEFVEHNIDLRDMAIMEKSVDSKTKVDPYKPIIDLGEGVKIQLRYPSIDNVIDNAADLVEQGEGNIKASDLFKFIRFAIDKIFYNEQQFTFADCPEKEQEEFLDNFNNVQLMKIGEFINNIPYVYLNHKFNHCDKDQVLELKGLQSFFS